MATITTAFYLITMIVITMMMMISTSSSPISLFVNAQFTVPIFTDISIEKLEKVDGVDQSFEADFVHYYQYPSLAPISSVFTSPTDLSIGFVPFDPNNPPAGIDFFNLEYANSNDITIGRQDVYFVPMPLPWLYFSQDKVKSPITIPPPNTTCWIFVFRRATGKFKSNLPLQDFPFDAQSVAISVRSAVPNHFLQVLGNENSTFHRPLKNDQLIQWTKRGKGGEVTSTVVNYEGVPFGFDQVNFVVLLDRVPTYYINKIVTGIGFLVLMSWPLFVLDVTDSNRLAIGATLFLAIVAYLFLVNADVPKISYSTRLDNFITWSMADIFASYLLHCVSYGIDKLARKRIREYDEQKAAEEESAKKTKAKSDRRKKQQMMSQSPLQELGQVGGNGAASPPPPTGSKRQFAPPTQDKYSFHMEEATKRNEEEGGVEMAQDDDDYKQPFTANKKGSTTVTTTSSASTQQQQQQRQLRQQQDDEDEEEKERQHQAEVDEEEERKGHLWYFKWEDSWKHSFDIVCLVIVVVLYLVMAPLSLVG